MNGKIVFGHDILAAISLFTILVSSSVGAQDRIYSWLDDDDVMHFTNDPADISCWDEVFVSLVVIGNNDAPDSESQPDDPDSSAAEKLSSKPTWPDSGFAELVEYVDDKAGADAIDCGLFNVTSQSLNDEPLTPGFECVESAIRNGKGFKHGRYSRGIDNWLYEVVIRTESATNWYGRFWRNPSLGGPFKSCRCESIEFDVERRSFDVVDCVRVQ